MRKLIAAAVLSAAAVAVPVLSAGAAVAPVASGVHKVQTFDFSGVVPGGVLHYSSNLSASAS